MERSVKIFTGGLKALGDQGTFGKVTKHHKHNSSQEVSPFPAGDHKAATNRHDSTKYTKMKHN